MAREQRPVNPEALKPHTVPEIRCALGTDTIVAWRYTVLVPVAEVKSQGAARPIASEADLQRLEDVLSADFGGVSEPATVPSFRGFGPRDPLQPLQTREENRHAAFIVYAAAHGASDRYFLALRRELEDALVEGVILVERQDVTIL